jgi:outer membrane protein OmpA-like peptidoglycan-associated protein
MLDELDDGARVGVWVTLSLITLLLFGLLGGLALRQLSHGKAAAAPVAVAAPAGAHGDDSLLDAPLSGDLAGTLFFAMSEATLTPEAQAALAKVKPALEAATGRKVVLSGFHDASGDPAKNAELAKERAKAVREALKTAGIDASRIALRKPESTTADGPPEQARRVEIRLVD